MKKFFKEFKAFISRGNILDMAVGVIIGGAFSAIVTALTNQILMPLINWAIGGAGGLDAARTPLGKVIYTTVTDAAGNPQKVIDWSQTLYIDWGAFITAIINFLLIALVLFIVLKVVMKSSQMLRDAKAGLTKGQLSKEDKAELKARGIDRADKEAVNKYLAEKEAKLAAQKAKEDEAKRLAEEEAKKNSTEYLLKEIRDLLKAEKQPKPAAKPVQNKTAKK